MDSVLRGVAVVLEVLVLTGIIYCILAAVKLAAHDFGVAPKYGRPIVLFMVAAGIILVAFFATHLSLFYPSY